MNKLCRNYNHTLCHPEAAAEGSGHKSTMSSRFFTAFRMTFCPSSSSCMTAAVLTCLLLSLPTQAKWGDNCTLNGGTIIKANEYGNDKGGYCNDPNNPDLTNNCNGMEFCMSNKTMNWWSAFTWCDSIGGKLASFTSACPDTQMATPGPCPNLKGLSNKGTDWIQTSVGWDTKLLFSVSLKTGEIAHDSRYTRSSNTDYYALCEEN